VAARLFTSRVEELMILPPVMPEPTAVNAVSVAQPATIPNAPRLRQKIALPAIHYFTVVFSLHQR
jgi:hypothetical protein